MEFSKELIQEARQWWRDSCNEDKTVRHSLSEFFEGNPEKPTSEEVAQLATIILAATITIHISGRRWFDRINGNTYHTVQIYIDGELVQSLAMAYGYDRQYMQTAEEWLDGNGYLEGREKYAWGGKESISRYAERTGTIKVSDSVADVGRKRDL